SRPFPSASLSRTDIALRNWEERGRMLLSTAGSRVQEASHGTPLRTDQVPVPPPSYHHTPAGALHLDALTLLTRPRLLALCQCAVHLAQPSSPLALPAGRGGAPRVYRAESLLLLALLRTLWRLSYQEVHDWLVAWPPLALACGFPVGPDGRV